MDVKDVVIIAANLQKLVHAPATAASSSSTPAADHAACSNTSTSITKAPVIFALVRFVVVRVLEFEFPFPLTRSRSSCYMFAVHKDYPYPSVVSLLSCLISCLKDLHSY